jgi:hypothetical protein
MLRSFVACPVCHGHFVCACCSGWSRRRRHAVRGDGRTAGAGCGRSGFWEDLLGELRRAGLIAELLADGVIAEAVAQAEHGHKLDRALTAEVTAMAVIAGALFPDQGYDLILARTFARRPARARARRPGRRLDTGHRTRRHHSDPPG